MTVSIAAEVKPGFSFHYRRLAEQVVEAALEAEQFPYEAEVSLTLTDNSSIREINRRMRGIDSPTDVISFPMLCWPAPADYTAMEDQWGESINPDSGEIVLGDIVLSADRVRTQAEEYGHSQRREYAFLITHSMLHLLGYDHMKPEEAAVMEDRQRTILAALHIER